MHLNDIKGFLAARIENLKGMLPYSQTRFTEALEKRISTERQCAVDVPLNNDIELAYQINAYPLGAYVDSVSGTLHADSFIIIRNKLEVWHMSFNSTKRLLAEHSGVHKNSREPNPTFENIMAHVASDAGTLERT